MTKEEYVMYLDMNIDVVRLLRWCHRQIQANLYHASQCYGKMNDLHADDIAMAILEAGDFLYFEYNEALDKMRLLKEKEFYFTTNAVINKRMAKTSRLATYANQYYSNRPNICRTSRCD